MELKISIKFWNISSFQKKCNQNAQGQFTWTFEKFTKIYFLLHFLSYWPQVFRKCSVHYKKVLLYELKRNMNNSNRKVFFLRKIFILKIKIISIIWFSFIKLRLNLKSLSKIAKKLLEKKIIIIFFFFAFLTLPSHKDPIEIWI